MRTLDELLYYCEEPEPVGAILLTGEWGCGKTYLIDNDLKDALENKAHIIRISLFGIASIAIQTVNNRLLEKRQMRLFQAAMQTAKSSLKILFRESKKRDFLLI